jgi:hypothetical protein
MSDVRFGNWLAMKTYSNFAKGLEPKPTSGPSYQEKQAARRAAEAKSVYGKSDTVNLQMAQEAKKNGY